MVRLFVMEPSTISVSSVEGSALETEPSVILTSSVEGSALEIEPSVKLTSSVEGSKNRMVVGRVDFVMPGQVFREMTRESASPGKPKIGKLQEMF